MSNNKSATKNRRRIDHAPTAEGQSTQEPLERMVARRTFAQRYALVVVAIAALAIVGLVILQPWQDGEVEELTATKLAQYKHDEAAFTQGLLVHDGKLYESTGRRGESSVRIVDLESGEPIRLTWLDESLFGEGITIWEDRLIQLTWQAEKILVFDKDTLELLEEHPYDGEGWGLTHDEEHLILSNGSARLKFLDPNDYSVVKTLEVTLNGNRLKKLNELEYVDGWIYANVWYKDYIVKIDPGSGEVVSRIDLKSLYPKSQRGDNDAVLNGIAYDAERDVWFVTGKLWPHLFEVEF